ncbi:hypothetical protein IFM89_007292 [Coptis chinensis]|uniref:KIB1-4 beta-propeller domain-containing protein n=1 Tax=Coptis chinensis TaxID=261450 RepID=A0A835GWD9_9MAGN|nr:hypothetical protein IFM89_007292 [Coptis chinensis]
MVSHPPAVLILPTGHMKMITYKLVFITRPGKDDAWTETEYSCKDLKLYNGVIYALGCYGKVCVLKGLDGSSLPTMQSVISLDNYEEGSVLLIEMSSDLLKVVQISSYVGRFKTQCFKVFKLDLGESKWVEVEYLGNIVLFVCLSYSFSLMASNFPGCKGNYIYFFSHDDKGIFNLEDGTVETIYQSNAHCGYQLH